MESQKSKNRKIFNILLFIFACAVLYLHLKKVAPTFQKPTPKPLPSVGKDLESAVEKKESIIKQISASPEQSHNSNFSKMIKKCMTDTQLKEWEEQCPQEACLYESLKRNGSWVANWIDDGWISAKTAPSPVQITLLGKIHYGLGQAGFLEGNDNVPSNIQEGLKIFLELSQSEPQNSFYTLFIALFYHKLGNLDQADLYVRKSSSEEMYFNSHSKDFVKELRSISGTIPEKIKAFALQAVYPVPNYIELSKFLERYPKDSLRIGQQLMDDGLQKPRSEADWSPIEYVIGRSLYNKAHGQKTYPQYKTIVNSYLSMNQNYENMSCPEFIDYMLL